MDEDGVALDGSESESQEEESPKAKKPKAPKKVSLKDLQRQLEEAIATENYELASELKKRIDKFEG